MTMEEGSGRCNVLALRMEGGAVSRDVCDL